MEINKTIQIDAAAVKVWEILWGQYGKACDWASTVNTSKMRKDTINEFGGRSCHSSFGEVSEIVDSVNEKEMTLQYHLDGMPAMIKSGVAKWKLKPTSINTTEVTMNLNMTFAKIPIALMGWLIKPKMKKDINQTMIDLKHYVETGRQTEVKKKSDAKFNKKKGNKAA